MTDAMAREELMSSSSGDRMLAVLGLFTVERSEWTVDVAAEELGVSATTAYRYFKRLTNAGLLFALLGGSLWSYPTFKLLAREAWKRGPRGLAAFLGDALVPAGRGAPYPSA